MAAAPSGAPPDQVQQQPVSATVVTLITGDVVQLSTFHDGKQSATVRPGPLSSVGSFVSETRDGHTYVIPRVAQAYVASGLLDEKLFDVTELAAEGYDDTHAAALPLILQYAADPANASGTRAMLTQPVPSGARRSRDLPSVASVAVSVPRGQSVQFWNSVGDKRPGLAARAKPLLDRHLRRIWLDAKAKASLDVSVPLIGAPVAWQAGFDGTGVTVAVLDTGIDTSHPDLSDRVVDSQNFSASPDAIDHFGHGTHVASIVAGSGAASGGRYTGVAKGAKLLNGKVLDDNGSGPDSQIIAGMEWAAARAKIVSMSLGGGPTDGTDPLSEAVNRLSAQFGILFVIAAGNSGLFFDHTVATPGAADAALTVAASTKTDVRAGFSSRGPRVGDSAVKPEIIAPGVNIVAARAAGTNLGTPVGTQYTTLSGTSMATPHVAGAAAIVAGQHPDWTGQQLKAALIATSKPLPAGTIYEQGAGRVDLAHEVTNQVTVSTGALSMGRFEGPYGSVAPVHRTVTYHNDSTSDVTLDLAVSATAGAATAGPDMLGVSPATVTVPAGGSADATVTLDPNVGPLGLYGGRLVATGRDGKTGLVTAVGFDKDLLHTVTIDAIAHDGQEAKFARVSLWNLDTNQYQVVIVSGQPVQMRLHEDHYFVFAGVATLDASGTVDTESAAVARPEVTVDHDMSILLDARGAGPVDVSTPKPTAPLLQLHQVYRTVPRFSLSIGLGASDRMLVVPSDPATIGQLEYDAELELEAPVLTMKIAGANVNLHPRYLTPATLAAARLDGNRKLPAVFVGAGRPDDYIGRDVRGKVALVRSTAGLAIEDQVAAAAAAKAAMVAVLAGAPGVFRPPVSASVALPTVGLDQPEATDLLRRLGQGPVTLDMTGTPFSPFHYELVLPYAALPPRIDFTADATNTALQHNHVYAVQPNQIGSQSIGIFRPLTSISISFVYDRPVPFQQDRIYSTAPGTTFVENFYASFANFDLMQSFESFTAGQETTKTWFKGPLRSGQSTGRFPTSRRGDQIFLGFDSFVDAEPDHFLGQQGQVTAARIYRDGDLIAQNRLAVGTFNIGTAQPDTYRVELDVSQGRPGWVVSPEVYSAWTFRSQRPADPAAGFVAIPVLTANWDLDLDATNAARAGHPFTLRLNARTQPGADPVPVTGATVFVSYDDGGTWREIAMTGTGGQFTGTVHHPKMRDTTGFVSLKYQLTDASGGILEQTIYRAYALK